MAGQPAGLLFIVCRSNPLSMNDGLESNREGRIVSGRSSAHRGCANEPTAPGLAIDRRVDTTTNRANEPTGSAER
jgi:hypothetical protein